MTKKPMKLGERAWSKASLSSSLGVGQRLLPTKARFERLALLTNRCLSSIIVCGARTWLMEPLEATNNKMTKNRRRSLSSPIIETWRSNRAGGPKIRPVKLQRSTSGSLSVRLRKMTYWRCRRRTNSETSWSGRSKKTIRNTSEANSFE